MDDESQFVGEDDHDGEKRFPDHDHRFPEDVSLAVGSVDEAADFVDPSILVVFFNLLCDEECDREWKSEGEDDEEWPRQQISQRGMRSLVAFNTGVHCPVVCCPINPNCDRVMDFDAVEDVDERLGDGNVTDVEDDECAEDTLPQEMRP